MIEFSIYKNKINLQPYNRPKYLKLEEREAVINKLMSFFLKERGETFSPQINYIDKRKLLKALMNLRLPQPIPHTLLALQDELLWSETLDKGIVQKNQLDFYEGIALWQGDITRLQVDAIVNAANSQMLGCFQPQHFCIDNVIHSAGGLQIRNDCSTIMELQGSLEPTGVAKVTRAYNLPSTYILHTVGTVVNDVVTRENEAELISCYKSCLELAKEMRLNTIAFCCISTGEFKYPKSDACKIAVFTIKEWLKMNKGLRIIFNIFLDEDREFYEHELSIKT